jgi:pimeloyl-ACP methyl ester carboxylesterase
LPNAHVVTGAPVEVQPGRFVHLAVHEGDGRGVVFLCHGAGGSKNQWRNQWRLFTRLGWTVVAWDFFGHGEAPAPRKTAAYDGAALVGDYLALVERYAGARNILIGHSYGARLTLCVLQALEADGRLSMIERAVLLGAPPPIPTLGLGPIATWPLWLLVLMRPMINANFVKLAWHPSADPALVAFEDRAARRNSLFMMKSLLTQSAPIDAGGLSGLTLPVLILAGDSDGVTPLAGAQMLAGALPDARLETIAACGHQIMLERPAETNALIRAFLSL